MRRKKTRVYDPKSIMNAAKDAGLGNKKSMAI